MECSGGVQCEKSLCIPKPLDVGVRHGDEDVVPPRSPLNRIVFLLKEATLFNKISHTASLLLHYYCTHITNSLEAYLKSDRVGVND